MSTNQDFACPPAGLIFPGPRPQRLVACLLGGLLVAAFLPTMVELFREWIDRPEASHGLLMPPVAAWLIYERRHQFARLRRGDSAAASAAQLLAALAIIPAMAILLLGEMKLSWYLKPYALVAALVAAFAGLYGWRALRPALPAVVALLLMCPLPGRVERDLTVPLKNLSAILATGMLDLSGFQTTLEGNLIHLPGIESLWIADACSGIRSLISLVSVAILACLVWRRSWLLKLLAVLSCAPIAVFVNASRIWLTGFLSVRVSPAAAQGFFHVFEGFLLFAVAALLLWGWTLFLGLFFPAGPAAEAAPAGTREDLPSRPATSPFPRALWVASAVLILTVTAGAVEVHRVRAALAAEDADPDAVRRLHESLDRLPSDLAEGRYVAEPLEVSKEVVAYSGTDSYISLLYETRLPREQDRSSARPRTYHLYIGGSVRNEHFHAPSYCMPAQGWEALQQSTVPLPRELGAASGVAMRRLLVQKGAAQMVVYYWFQAGKRVANHEWTIRWYRFLDMLKGEPLQPTVIVTVYVPVIGSTAETEEAAAGFFAALGPHLREAIALGVENG
ncbi:MAG: exosortase C-terminal domain/associated protein EpsI [Planctomycetaceae bacterium]